MTTIIRTNRFGNLEIDEDKIITMTTPLLGFAEERQFILLPHGPKSAFWWLQSVGNPDLAFVVIQPTIINQAYQPAIPPHCQQELQVASQSELEILVILTIPKGQPEAMTANLLGPVVLNPTKKLAKQVLLDPAQYDLCWPVMAA
ncbi:MAG: flagellar assembly protein FliW [Desulfobulbaceae bacterium]|nr:flagellar assembly protein FliW [Desulfobulbaceae bacterium]